MAVVICILLKVWFDRPSASPEPPHHRRFRAGVKWLDARAGHLAGNGAYGDDLVGPGGLRGQRCDESETEVQFMKIGQVLRTALGHHRAGQLSEAEALYREVLAQSPDHADALHLLGILATQAGRPDGAVELIGRAVTSNPAVAEYHLSLAEAYRSSGQWEAAIASLHRAIELRPAVAEPYNTLGVTLALAGRPEDAVTAYHRAIELEPDHAWAYTNLGNAWHAQGRLYEAVAAYERAIVLDAELAEAHSNLGTVLHETRRFTEAVAAYERAIELKPDHPQAHYNLGCVRQHQGRLDEAIAALERAIELNPDLPEPYNTLGNLFKDQGHHDEALASFRKALERKPDFLAAASNLLYALHFHPGYDAQALLAAHRRWARQYAEPLAAEIHPHPNDPAPGRKLRVGFLSPDFRDHPVGQSLLATLLPSRSQANRGRSAMTTCGYLMESPSN